MSEHSIALPPKLLFELVLELLLRRLRSKSELCKLLPSMLIFELLPELLSELLPELLFELLPVLLSGLFFALSFILPSKLRSILPRELVSELPSEPLSVVPLSKLLSEISRGSFSTLQFLPFISIKARRTGSNLSDEISFVSL